MPAPDEADALYRALLGRWNERDAAGFAALFAADGSVVGFDGTSVETPGAIARHLGSVFADHQPATYVAKVREVRPLGPAAVLVRSVVGMVPPGASDINAEANAVQSLVAVETGAGWRIAHFQNTPAAFHGRPEDADALTEELRRLVPPRHHD